MKTPHCSVTTITYNGNLIVGAAQKYPAVAARLPADYLTETATALGKLPADVYGQKDAKGETGVLTTEQHQNFDMVQYWMNQARKTARRAFFGQTVKLHQEFLVGNHASHEVGAVLGRADVIIASVQKPANLAAMKLKGWTEADSQKFVAVRGTFPASSIAQQSGQSEGKKMTLVKDADAADAYDHVLTVQGAADLEYPATDPDNAPIRAEFRIGLFPPDHHSGTDTPTPPPTPPPPQP